MIQSILRSMLLIILTFFFYQSNGQTYLGSESCEVCHQTIYDTWNASGHPYKFNVIENDQPPVYPAEAINFQSEWMDSVGGGSHTWADVAGVIGGYGWKARFVGKDGHLIGTANSSLPDAGVGHNQINFFGGVNYGWANYHPNDEKIYNYSCFKCHTTGGDTNGSWLEGVDGLGTFTEGGIGCEACHGPGSAHVEADGGTEENRLIDRVYEQAHLDNALGGLSIDGVVQLPDPNGDDVNFMCGTCHNRSYTDPINSSGGFIRHHEQWDEFVATEHYGAGFTCITCHDPHKRVIWDGDGIIKTCESCHPNSAATVNHSPNATCIDCHMPFASKSGTARGLSGYKGDVRTHLWTIATNAESMFTEDGSAVKDDGTRSASLSPGFSCLGCHNDDPNDNIPNQTLEYAADAAKGMHVPRTYATSFRCQNCHTDKYNDWAASGHPYKFNVIENDQPPVYPGEAINFQSEWMDSLGDGSHTWADVAGVIGGYGWKARFVGKDGHLIGTANSSLPDAGVGHNQINFFGGENLGWSNYHPNDEKIYNYSCFKCHTTGGTTEGTWLEGVDGLGHFTEGGIGCEACHGPGNEHMKAPSKDNIDLVYEQAHLDNALGGLSIDGVVQLPDPEGDDINFMCGTCHNRSYTDPINASGGFIRHHEQWDEFVTTAHYEADFTCVTCHDPHKRTIWDGDAIKFNCEGCHQDQVAILRHSPGLECIDCHMPFAAKSGAKRGLSGFKGDVRSHLMTITPDTASMFTADGGAVRDDDTRPASLSPAFSCLGCHNDDPNDNIPDKTLEAAALLAIDMHKEASSVFNMLDDAFRLSIYPNPATDKVIIDYTLLQSTDISIRIYDMAGKLVFSNKAYEMAGNHNMTWYGNSNTGNTVTSGIYFVNITSSEAVSTKKLVFNQ